MNKSIQAIETIYNGYRFRSRLEARWATFFDKLNIQYMYEPEGVKLSDGVMYLPDFYLPESETFFEVKGILTKKDLHKIEQLQSDSDAPVVIGYSDMTFEASDNIFGSYSFASKSQSVLAICCKCKKYHFLGINGGWTCPCCGYYDGDNTSAFIVNGKQDFLGYTSIVEEYEDKALEAFKAAKQARFEHGETPKR